MVVSRTCGTPSSGVPVHRAAMSEGRFSFLLAFLLLGLPQGREVEKYGTYSRKTVQSFNVPGAT